MKPYYDDGKGRVIYHGDCREILPTLPKCDLCLTDPPYGIALSNNDVDGHRAQRDWTIKNDESQQVGIDALKILEDVPQVVFASPMKPWPGTWRQFLVWEKGEHVGGGGDVKTCWKPTWELIQVRNTPVLNGGRDGAVIKINAVTADYSFHPSPKPVALIKYLLRKVPAGSVIDPFMGSGTTLVAAKLSGLSCVGIELEEKYCEIAARRLCQDVIEFN